MNEFASTDLLWVLLCAGQVLLMQAGFCLLESGMSRAKNSINVAIKNLVDLCIAAIAFWAVGFGLMYGQSIGGWFGTSGFALGEQAGAGLIAFFIFQVVFCGTATTIISGAVAERIRFRSYVIVSVIVSAVVYPVFGHWAWGGALEGTPPGWLTALGFIDFAGSTVVHSVGAWVALAAVIIVGPRLGRFSTRSRRIQSSNLPMVVLGVLVLWFGWLGFNGGSGLGLTAEVPMILLNTVLAAAAGGVVSLAIAIGWWKSPDVATVGNGVIAGLVGVTAGCHLLSPPGALWVGGIAGALCFATGRWLERWRVDDVIGAIPAHGIPGVWGTVAIALLTDPARWGNGHDRLTQLAIQSLGCFSAFAWAFGVSLATLWLVNKICPLRVPRRHEYIGLNIAEHQANSELLDLLTQMNRHRQGREFNRRVKVEPFTEIGQVAAAYNRVITEVDQEMEGRLKAQQQYQSIFDHAVEGIYQTHPDGSFRSANPAMAELCGYDSPEQLCQAITSVGEDLYVDPGTRDRFLLEIALRDRVSQFRSQLRRKDGSTIWISENARAVRDQSGSVLYFEGTVVDISQRLVSEQLRLQKEQAEAANNAKSEFLAGMSHEMRTPLNGIVSMLDLMDENELAPQQAKYLQIARRSSATLLAIINDILDLSKIESGKLELESVPFSLVDLVDETVEMLYHRAKSKGLTLSARIDEGVPAIVSGDAVRLQQILINLISNAIKFTNAGEVALRVRCDAQPPRVGLGVTASRWLRLEVADTGIGIPTERQSKIFDPFIQADASTTRRFGGSGLGLNICKQLVGAMDGELTVESELGVGSTFACVIPAIEPEGGLRSAPSQNILLRRPNSTIAGARVLLVAPDHGETRVVADYLERWGADCQRHDSTASALAAIADPCATPPVAADLLLLDTALCPQDDEQRWSTLASRCRRTLLLGEPPSGTQVDVARSLDKPVRPSALFESLEVALTDADRGVPRRPWPQQPKADSDIGQGRRVLVVDDNEINTIVACELLERLGFNADSVSSAAEAIAMAKTHGYDVILMDCEMPVMDGFDATRELRKLHRQGELHLPPGEPLRIIALTAQALAGQVERCFRSGMNAHLAKPINRTDFARTLRDVFEVQPDQSEWAEATAEVQPTADDQAPADRTEPGEPVINWDEVVGRCGNSEPASVSVIQMFREQLPQHYRDVVASVEADDVAAVAAKLHRLKGVAATMSAVPIASLVESMEPQVEHLNRETFTPSLARLEREVERCLDWIEAKLQEVNQA